MQESPSEHNKNRYGDIGSPCLMPQDGLKPSEKTPLTRIEKDTDETHFMTKEHHEPGNPNTCITAFR
jgi:hypothetical protein